MPGTFRGSLQGHVPFKEDAVPLITMYFNRFDSPLADHLKGRLTTEAVQICTLHAFRLAENRKENPHRY
jgi:hypothetical protein